MSVDAVDDLEGAEDLAGTLARALRDLLNDPTKRGYASAALVQHENYCRATCNPNDDDEGCTNEYCGCPHHAKENAT